MPRRLGKETKKPPVTAAAKPATDGRQGRLFYGFNQAALTLSAFVVLLPDFHELTHDVSAGLSVHRF